MPELRNFLKVVGIILTIVGVLPAWILLGILILVQIDADVRLWMTLIAYYLFSGLAVVVNGIADGLTDES